MLRAGVSFPWLAGGRRVIVPELTLGEVIDLKSRDVARLRELELDDETPAEIRERILDIVDTAFLADSLYLRLSKADLLLTREAFDGALRSRGELVAAWGALALQDGRKNPNAPRSAGGLWTDHPASDVGSTTRRKWWRIAWGWLAWRPRAG